jgi:alkanesulfonate monooxygenase SsuD/methylene tetrahydromethanopterin reductase-like flavin-dependent oxidoreductase (luciferase family)
MPKLKEIGLLVENVNARDYVTQAQTAERLGFNSFWVPEDYAFPGAFSCWRPSRLLPAKSRSALASSIPSHVIPCLSRWNWRLSIRSPQDAPSLASARAFVTRSWRISLMLE